jgi:Mn-dependent DtxR family transcriptional regulator
MAKLTEEHQRVLLALADFSREQELYLPFRRIVSESEVEPHRIRRIVRHLARKGLAQYERGLWTDDGEPAGSGYCITHQGRTVAEAMRPLPEASAASSGLGYVEQR